MCLYLETSKNRHFFIENQLYFGLFKNLLLIILYLNS